LHHTKKSSILCQCKLYRVYSLGTDRTENITSNSASIFAYVSVAAVTWCSPGHCLTIGVFTEAYPRNWCLYWLSNSGFESQSQSQSYFTTAILLPISSSWLQTSWGSRPEFLQLSPCGHSPYVTPSLTRGRVCLLWIDLAMLRVRIAYVYIFVTCYWEFFILHYIHTLCQSRLCKADHAYLTYLMLQREVSHLNGRKLDHRKV
jgi:hypothetical protein